MEDNKMKNIKKYLILTLFFGLSSNLINTKEIAKKHFNDAIKIGNKDNAIQALKDLEKEYGDNAFVKQKKQIFSNTFNNERYEDLLDQQQKIQETKERQAAIRHDKDDRIDDINLETIQQRLNDTYETCQKEDTLESVIDLLEAIGNAEEHHVPLKQDILKAKNDILSYNGYSTLAEALVGLTMEYQETLNQKTPNAYNPEEDRMVRSIESNDRDFNDLDDVPYFRQDSQEADDTQYSLGILRGREEGREEAKETIKRLERELLQAKTQQLPGDVNTQQLIQQLVATRQENGTVNKKLSSVQAELAELTEQNKKLKKQIKSTQELNTIQRKQINQLKQQIAAFEE